MRAKNSVKRVGQQPDFWKRQRGKNDVPQSIKDFVYGQLYSINTLFLYCDTSNNIGRGIMAVACTYVYNGSVFVKQQYVHPPTDSKDKPIFGEISALIFALKHFEKHVGKECETVVLYTDINFIDALLNGESKFRKSISLQKLHKELVNRYEQIVAKDTNRKVTIEYLSKAMKKSNPFHKTAHNSANKMVSFR